MITYTTPDGKQWEVVDVRKPTHGESFVTAYGKVEQFCYSMSELVRPIVRPIVPEWITPTDEDAKQRPMVEVRDRETDRWQAGQLLAVIHREMPFIAFITKTKVAAGWGYCRMRNPEYKANP